MSSRHPSSDSNTPVWLRHHAQGAVLLLVIQPRASKTEIVGPHGEPPRLKIRVAAPPVEGEANAELIRFFSKKLKVPKSRIELLRGETSKQKDLLVQGIDTEEMKKLIP